MSPPAEVRDQLCWPHNSTGPLWLDSWHVPEEVHRVARHTHGHHPSLEGPLMGTVQSRDTNNWYTYYSEVKIKGLLKYKLTLLNYYFIFITTSYIRFQSVWDGQCIPIAFLEILIPIHYKYLLQGRLIIFITFFTFSYGLFLLKVLNQGGSGGTKFFLTLQALTSNLITKLCLQSNLQ